ncbi:MAG TPA: hypothetical protein VF292_07005 [Rhodanobacteraceae bacterium]
MLNERGVAALPFAIVGTGAIVAGGAIAAAVAYHPTEHLIWMVAYLVLVVGVVQWVLGGGEAWLAGRVPGPRTVWGQWVLFNLGNAGVIGGTLDNRTAVVAAGSVVFAVALAWFLYGVRGCRRVRWCVAYRTLLSLMLVSACVGVVISAVSNGAA